jgi:hypothetical protein
MTYDEVKESVRDDYQCGETQQEIFPSLQSITYYIFWNDLNDHDMVQEIFVYIALGSQAIEHGEVLEKVKYMLNKYHVFNMLPSIANKISQDEYESINADLQHFLEVQDSLRVVADLKDSE